MTHLGGTNRNHKSRIERMSVPPPPPPPQANASVGPPVGDNRGLLLQSIRAGKTLKKTVTVDKSAPAIAGRIKDESTNSSSSNSYIRTNNSSITTSVNSSNGPMLLGGLFAGGMPKLKPTGLRGNMTEKEVQSVNNSSFLHSSPGSSHSIKRGPPPVPPPAAQKPQLIIQGQSVTDSTTSNPEVVPRGFAKSPIVPNLAQSATLQKPSPPPKKLNLTSNASVARAQSMRLPRSPPVLVPSSLHQSQDCLNEAATPQPTRPANRVLRPPVTRPPAPPVTSASRSHTMSVTVTRAAPPPPLPPSRVTVTAPCIPPPPPPPLPHRPAPTHQSHQSHQSHQRLAPPPPLPLTPPTPPTRSLSVRNGGSQTGTSVDLEVRFAEMFHTSSNFPQPEPFRGFTKVYSSRNAKQQAPAPPLQSSSTPNTLHPLNTSSGSKQWQHNATSLAY